MNRKDFLSIIPSLGAIPFLSSKIIQEEKKIILLEPKQIEVVDKMPEYVSAKMDPDKFQFLLTYDGKVIGTASRFDIGLSDGLFEGISSDIDRYPFRTRRIEVRASFDHEQCMRTFMNMNL